MMPVVLLMYVVVLLVTVGYVTSCFPNSYTPRQTRTIQYRRFGNFGRLHYRIKEGGYLPYEG